MSFVNASSNGGPLLSTRLFVEKGDKKQKVSNCGSRKNALIVLAIASLGPREHRFHRDSNSNGAAARIPKGLNRPRLPSEEPAMYLGAIHVAFDASNP